MPKLLKISFILFSLCAVVNCAYGQGSLSGANVVTTAVPSLTIAPDARAAGMGETGVATSPDIYSHFWNPAKYAFLRTDSLYLHLRDTVTFHPKSGVALSYSPWLRSLVKNIHMAYLSSYLKLDDYQTFSSSLKYFSLGDMIFYDEFAQFQGKQTPNEFAVDLAYSRLLTERLAGSVAFRFIRSDLTGGQLINSHGSVL